MFPEQVTSMIDTGVLTYFVALQGFYTILILLSVFEIARHQAQRLPELDATVLLEESSPPVTILVPSHNEQTHVVDTVRSLLALDYPRFEILVINDGSTDQTLEKLVEAFDLQRVNRAVKESIPTAELRGIYNSKTNSDIWLIDKEQGGKSDALNAGINATRTPIFCSIDADTVVTKDALLRMSEAFIHDPEGVIAVGGTVRVGNGCQIDGGVVEEVGAPDCWLARFQQVEYMRAFVFGRLGLNPIGGNLIISGAFGLFSRDAVVAVGGYDPKSVSEDMELVVKLHRYRDRHGGRVVQLSEPIAYTEVPETWSDLATQRARWHRGLGHTLIKHRAMMGRRRYGAAGMIVMPLFVLFELLGPVFEVMGYAWVAVAIAFGFLDVKFGVAFFVVALLWGFLLTLGSVVADRWTFRSDERASDGGKTLVVAFLENLGYRQMTLLFRLRGLFDLVTGKQGWGQIERRGHGRQPALPATKENQ